MNRSRIALARPVAAITLAAGVTFGCATSSPPIAFSSCDEAKAAVQRAGETGIALPSERVYSAPYCFYGFPPAYNSFEVHVEIAGKQCVLGYTCVEISAQGI